MSSFFDKLNLSPQERRLVVFAGLFLFVVLNVWLVWPHFGDLGLWQRKKQQMANKLRQFQLEIAKKSVYEREYAKLESSGETVADFRQAQALQRTVNRQAISSRVHIANAAPRRSSNTESNAFFDEVAIMVTFESGQKELVDFLYNLGASGSLIRVRSMTLGPSMPGRTKLQGNIELVASYRKGSETENTAAAAAASRRTNPAPAPAASPPEQASTDGSESTSPPSVPAPPAPAAINPAVTRRNLTRPPTAVRNPERTNSGTSVPIPRRRILTPPRPPNNS